MFISKADTEYLFAQIVHLGKLDVTHMGNIEALQKTHERDLGLVAEEIRVAAEVYISLVKSVGNLKKDIVLRFDELYAHLDVSRFEHEDGSYELIPNAELKLELMFDALPESVYDASLTPETVVCIGLPPECLHHCGLVDGHCCDCDTQVFDPATTTLVTPDTAYTDNFKTHNPKPKKAKKKKGKK